MGDLRNKVKKEAEQQAARDRERRRREGWTIFHFDFDPRLTRRNLSPGDALRYLMKVTHTEIALWRCPVRGWAVEYHKLEGQRERYRVLHFANVESEAEAKTILGEDVLLFGVDQYRGLPNAAFDERVRSLTWLLTAPPSIVAKDWLAVKAKLPRKTQRLLQTHEADLRLHLLGQPSIGPLGPAELTVRARLDGGSASL